MNRWLWLDKGFPSTGTPQGWVSSPFLLYIYRFEILHSHFCWCLVSLLEKHHFSRIYMLVLCSASQYCYVILPAGVLTLCYKPCIFLADHVFSLYPAPLNPPPHTHTYIYMYLYIHMHLWCCLRCLLMCHVTRAARCFAVSSERQINATVSEFPLLRFSGYQDRGLLRSLRRFVEARVPKELVKSALKLMLHSCITAPISRSLWIPSGNQCWQTHITLSLSGCQLAKS